jgi:hypothetical protein
MKLTWNPKHGEKVKIGNSKCLWTVQTTKSPKWDPKKVGWDAQITAPMPLEGLYSLLSDSKQQKMETLIGYDRYNGERLEYVTKEFFQTSPNKISSKAVTDDVLGFCSLVLSYAKAAESMQPNASPKMNIAIMPRTDFNTMFKQVSKKIGGDLFQLFDVLACYKSTWDHAKKKYTVRYV